MKIKEAICQLKQISERINDNYIISRLKCIIEDLENYKNVDDDYEIRGDISKRIEGKNSAVDEVNHKWVNELYQSILGMFRYEQCREYYNNYKKEVEKVIDGETFSKLTTVISAVFTVIISCVAIILYFQGYGKDGGGNFNYDGLAFIITFGIAMISIIAWIIASIYNRINRKKYGGAPYSVDELLAVKYEAKPKMLEFLSPMAAKISQCPSIIIASGKGAQASGRDSYKIKGKKNLIVPGNGNSVNITK